MKALAAVLLAATFAASALAAGPAVKHTSAGSRTAKAALLTLKDLGKGWQAGATGQPGLRPTCRGWSPSGRGIVETGAAGSPAFAASSVGPFVSQTSSTYSTAAQAAAYWTRATGAGLLGCVARTVQSLRARGVSVKITSQGPLAVAKAAPRTTAFRIVATLGEGTKQARKLYFDVILLGRGNTLTEISLSSFVSAIPAKVENALASLVAHRLGGLPTA